MADEEIDEFEERQDRRRSKVLGSHAAQLDEHFDTVQIICTAYDPQDGTSLHRVGIGNFYARVESAMAYVRLSRKK